jgi:putative membrane protein (TIGR04086 family)
VSDLDVRTVVAGSLVSLAIIVPVALIARLVVGDDDTSSAWSGAFTIFIMVATLVGSGFAGRRRPDTPMIHGAAAGALTYVAARVVSAVLSGEVPNIVALVFAVFVFAALGAIGGFVATSFVRGSSNRESPR